MQLDAARKLLLKRIGQEPWFLSVGVGKFEANGGQVYGLIVSVRKNGMEPAKNCVKDLGIDVPVRVRALGDVSAQ